MVAIIIVPGSLKPAAEKCVAMVSPGSVGESLTIPLGPIGKTDGPPTHWASLPIVSDEALEQLGKLSRSPMFAGQAFVTTCEVERVPEAFAAQLESLGLERREVAIPGS